MFNETPDVRLKLLRLLGMLISNYLVKTHSHAEGAHGSLAEMFKLYITSKKIENINSPKYFENVVQRIESGILLTRLNRKYSLTTAVISVRKMDPPFYKNNQIHFFHEFPSATEGCLLTTTMELLFLPLSPSDISAGLFSYMHGKCIIIILAVLMR